MQCNETPIIGSCFPRESAFSHLDADIPVIRHTVSHASGRRRCFRYGHPTRPVSPSDVGGRPLLHSLVRASQANAVMQAGAAKIPASSAGSGAWSAGISAEGGREVVYKGNDLSTAKAWESKIETLH
jgi:hypothetical protein